MRSLLAVLLLAVVGASGCLHAQAPANDLEKACGPKDIKLETSLSAPTTVIPEPASGKALVVFVEDMRLDRPGHKCFKCTDVSIALAADGAWIAQDKGFSHSVALLNPGVHHLCARTRKGNNDTPSMLSLTAEAGATYFLIAIPQYEFDYYVERFTLADSDEGRYLTAISKSAMTPVQ
ncbi:hypothetical protein [Terriglobus roseus]|uniref:DUF2846 domain-containing protein n=1 Tax=Terriglobus roseus TaxID=392734 RepID=A0A1H4J2N2_9BACT|nr:hypothetical protein [Terriglobus roseus]SEB40471.1 hypothetical protein SAMN05443244_0311 [Terriglobus roseus]